MIGMYTKKENYSLDSDSIAGFEILQVVVIMDFYFLQDYIKCYIKINEFREII